ncbi:MAG TPA: DUF1990 family protein [Solirubrobacteraceae bacterium]|nr:DUF1990 family protein [Solirubrobacteraceae bacterium]
MPRRPRLSRRLSTAARWPVGIGLTSWRYLWRTTPMRRAEVVGTWRLHGPPEIPPGVDEDELQGPSDGTGPLFHRRYRAYVQGARLSPEELFAVLQADPDRAAPREFASFQKVVGDEGAMRVGDEFVVRMPGPWDGPVRVLEVTPTSFRLHTLDGHLEAGQISFSGRERDGLLAVEIEAWARSGDRLSNLLYTRLRMAKEVQMHMWVSYLERIVELSGGRRRGALETSTHHVDEYVLEPARPMDEATSRALADMRERPLNFTPGAPGVGTPEHGWEVDRYCTPLPAEAPGDPVPDGSWETAQRLMREYAFADPAIIRATYDPRRSLEERTMLLEARFHGLRLHIGVRVSGVVDETRDEDGRRVRVWGWSYRTLQGHLEAGEMGYEAWKWLDTGSVEFRIHRIVRSAGGGNPLVRLGFRLFGRREQVRFARRAGERMAALVEAELEAGVAVSEPVAVA